MGRPSGRFARAGLLAVLLLGRPAALAGDGAPGRHVRERLVEADSTFAFSREVHLAPDEKDADAALGRLRALYLGRFSADPDAPFRSPFVALRRDARATALHQALRLMPKGGMLHIHSTATGRVEWIVDRALATPDCQVFWEETNDEYVHGQIGFFPGRPAPRGWTLLSDLKATHPDLRSELVALFSLGPEDLAGGDPWKEFNAIFRRIDGFVSYRPVFVDYYEDAYETLARDGVQFLELRTSLDPLQTETGGRVDSAGVVELHRSIVDRVGKRYPGFELSIIVTSYRQASVSDVREKMELAKSLAARFPGLVVGFDVVGEEDRGKSYEYYAPALGSRGALPLFLHAGESLSPTNFNVLDAWLLGTQRIGHGVNLVHFRHLEKRVRETGTLLEVCPISNQSLGYVPDLRLHPARGLLMRGMQGVLSSDDPVVFGTEGLTDDLWEAYVAWGLDLRSLKQLVRNSILRSSLPSPRKLLHLQTFNERWHRFVCAVNETWPPD